MISKRWSKKVSAIYDPLDIEIEPREDCDIWKWKTFIAGVKFECQSSGNLQEQLSRPYALQLWDSRDILPVLTFLKDHEEEFSDYIKKWRNE